MENQTPTWEELAVQLRKPEGDFGREVAKSMMKNNELIVTRMYDRLKLNTGDHILEIGMANGAHVKPLLERASKLTYTGVDYSEDMVGAASEFNRDLLAEGVARMVHANIDQLPFQADAFHSICTANTLYFWPNPMENMMELHRVARPGGQVVVGIRTREVMDKMQVTQYGFTLYHPEEVVQLMIDAGFTEVSFDVVDEPEREVMRQTFQINGAYIQGFKV